MKETAVCRQEKANCISSDILADMLDGTDFSVWSGRDPKTVSYTHLTLPTT